MSRFVNLEFNNPTEGSAEAAGTKDEAYYVTEAQAAFDAAQFEPALRNYAKVLEFNPQNVTAWTGQVRALIELEQYEEARHWAAKALERFPNNPELLAANAMALARSGDLQGALAFSDASIEESGNNPYVWLARGDVLLAREEKRAAYCFDKALALAPQDWRIVWLAARIRYLHEQFAPALRLVQQALEAKPGEGSLWLLAGLCQQRLGLTRAARQSLQQARQLNPHCRDTVRTLRALAAQGPGARLRGYWQRWFSK